ncbi:MAG: hypothetical protein FWF80_03005 [Defluviitaleaceae bacterium]|nr:hypothetical protein [Defluviitaleaceae bacterium]
MHAIKGYFTNGRFTPADNVLLPNYSHAILVIEQLPQAPSENTNGFWQEFDKLVDESANEEMPQFPRLRLGREIVTFTED